MKLLPAPFALLLMLSQAAAQDHHRFPDFDAPPQPGWGLVPDVLPSSVPSRSAARAARLSLLMTPRKSSRKFPNFDTAPLPGVGLHPDADATLIALNSPVPLLAQAGIAGKGAAPNQLPDGENDFRWARIFLDPTEYPRLLRNLDPYVMEEEAAWRALAFSRRSAAAGHPEGTLCYGFLLLERGQRTAALQQFERAEQLGRKVPPKFVEIAKKGAPEIDQQRKRRSPWLWEAGASF